jgi:hypothetical protein
LKLLGTRYRVYPSAADVFTRVFLLYGAPDFYTDNNEDEASVVKAHLLRMRMVDWEKQTYPPVVPCRKTRIFRDRSDFLACCDAHARREEMWRLFQAQDWDSAEKLVPGARSELEALLKVGITSGLLLRLKSCVYFKVVPFLLAENPLDQLGDVPLST